MEPKESRVSDEEQQAQDWREYEKGQKRETRRIADELPDFDTMQGGYGD